MNLFFRTLVIGALATGFMDIWGVIRKPLFGFPRADYRLVGRWFAYMPLGRFQHTSIASTPPMPGEHLIGWSVHYAIGISFAALLVWIGGSAWIARPTPGLAILVGVATVVAPLLLMQPGMGAGIAASRTPNPNAARLQTFLTHMVFGVGLYIAGCITASLLPLAR